MKTQLTTHKLLLSSFICFFVLLTTNLFSQNLVQSSKPSNLSNQDGSQDAVQLEKLEKLGGAFDTKIQQVLNEQVQLRKMKQEIKNRLTPEILAKKFVQEFRRTSKKIGLEKTKKYLQTHLKTKTIQEVGSISGTFKFTTESWRKYVTALAFDSYGYIAGIGESTYEYGWVGEEWLPTFKYTIENLAPGEYYVLTVTNKYAYVDEIYDNIPAPLFSKEGWRAAKKITVTAGAVTENISFELQQSADFLVTIYYPNGDVSSVNEATFTLTHFDCPEIMLQDFYEYNWTDGEFEFFVPFLGDFKLGVTPDNQSTTWYKNSNNWNDADKLTISSFPDTAFTWPDSVDSLDITLNYGGSDAQLGKISGMVNGNGEFKMIFAFKADDLSLANIAFIFYSYYTIEELEPGEYYVYAEDYMGNISEEGSLLGTFYKDAATVAEAEKVAVEEGQATYGIDIALRKGATIRGNIKDQENNPLESMLIVAMKMDFPEASAFNLFTKMHVGMGMADSSGNYRIAGLPPGDYILRTLSDYTVKIFWGFPSLDDGPYKGLVVDEFYGGFHNLFDFGKAQKISVSDTLTVENIDFVLQKAKYFKGKLFDALTSEKINQVLMVAFIDSSRDPFYLIPNINYYGDYEYGPLPSGKYRLLAAADHQQKDFYLAEFYENSTTFEDANVLELVDESLENIDFGFDRGAIIQGHIDLAEGQAYMPAGADTLFNFPIVLFDATGGSVKRNAYVQFDGGYRIPRLLPGNYKLLALPNEAYPAE
ncbi:carboxypeptidase regulatory-like domain-containing protein [candidate division KSB1 bacterium]|nr:carboxypeptidase regulatory-like domain-containing protein [candidate division KSB1 bacterium]MBL7112539.1 carboxypeptidase regulatory-like domain-containing protein [Bacteroidales bacterium]